MFLAAVLDTGRADRPGRPARRGHRRSALPGQPTALRARSTASSSRATGCRRARRPRRRPQPRTRWPVLPADDPAPMPSRASEILTEEVFGPVLTVQTFRDEDQAVAMANDTRFGLAATLVTGDPDRAERVSARADRRDRVGQLLLRPRPRRAVRRQRPVRASAARAALHSFDFYCDIKNTVFAPNGWTGGEPSDGRPMGEVVGGGVARARPDDRAAGEDPARAQQRRGLARWSRGCSSCGGEVFETLDYDTVVVLDSHWATTVEFVVTAQRAAGAGCSPPRSCPRGMCRRPYDFPGDPELAHAIAGARGRARHLDHRDRRRPPADLLRHHQPLGVPRPGPAGQALGVDRRLPDGRHRGQPAARPGPRRTPSPRPTARSC